MLCTCLVLPRSDPSFSTSPSSRVSRASFPEGSGRVSGTSYARFCVRMRASCARLRGSTRTNGDVSRANGVDTRTTCDRYTPADAPFLEGGRGGRRYRDGDRCTPFPFQTSRGDPRDVQRKGQLHPVSPKVDHPGPITGSSRVQLEGASGLIRWYPGIDRGDVHVPTDTARGESNSASKKEETGRPRIEKRAKRRPLRYTLDEVMSAWIQSTS